jgi:hypothetical protein
MDSATFDADDREAGITVSTGMLLLLGGLVVMHLFGLRFAYGVSGDVSL